VRTKLSLYPNYTDKGTYIRSTLQANGTLDLGSTRTGYHHTLSGRITLGYATNNTPFYERFYAGGTNTI
jgi:outer membrane protein assembly factor BamA